jgi:hypothetical protein
MRIPARNRPVIFSLVIILLCLPTTSVADDLIKNAYYQDESKSHWVCDYTRGRHDVLLLRCDNLVGLLYDHMMLKEGDESKTTQYIPIWNKSRNDSAAINLVKILLCKQKSGCRVEMSRIWASSN